MAVVAGFMVPHPPILLPEVGKGEEQKLEKTRIAYEKVARKIKELEPETIVVVTPHTVMYSDYFHISPGEQASGTMAAFQAPEVSFGVDYDTEFVEKLMKEAVLSGFPAGTYGEKDASLDHGTLIPLYFISKEYQNFNLVRIGLSGNSMADHYRLGMLIQKVAEDCDRSTVVIASGDLSHKLKEEGPYGFAPEGPAYDDLLMEIMGRGDFGQLLTFSKSLMEKSAECGHGSFTMMAGALDKKALAHEKLSYEGPFGVGYGICSFIVTEEDENRDFYQVYEAKRIAAFLEKKKQEDAYVSLARASIESFVKEEKVITAEETLPKEMLQEKAGAFVSIHKDGKLRGCIGTTAPIQKNLAEEIIGNAIAASTRDPRFLPITERELDSLEIKVDVLTAPEEISSEAELDPKRYGVIVRQKDKQGLLLPDLEGVDTVELQLEIAKEKAGIEKDAKNIVLYRFEVERHG